MAILRILYLHGWHSIVGGVKPTYLAAHGNQIYEPELDDDDFAAALATSQRAFDSFAPEVIVGSSRGGALAMNLRAEEVPMVLLCPAWKRWGDVTSVQRSTVIMHSRKDDVIPFEDSLQLVHNSRMPLDSIIETGTDHRLADEASLAAMLWACQILHSRTPLPWSDQGDDVRGEGPSSSDEGSYICDACGEEIVVPLDLSEGNHQRYVEDCPVCCRANVIHVDVDEDGRASVWAELEQDNDD
jgi:hypothetical protein